ncbi:MAG: hypothetical protein K2N73_03560 [Lachnospiraceae bacterium]|nr:hypothetical protein [Lachnospiraceae bacterium]
MNVILKFGGTLFVNLVFYDFFRGQLKPRVQNWKQLLTIIRQSIVSGYLKDNEALYTTA